MGSHITLIDEHLYLPKEWLSDRKYCKKAGVSVDIKFKTKSQIAFDIIREKAKRILSTWVGMNGSYGIEPDLLSNSG